MAQRDGEAVNCSSVKGKGTLVELIAKLKRPGVLRAAV